jgi:ATP synthase protein I
MVVDSGADRVGQAAAVDRLILVRAGGATLVVGVLATALAWLLTGVPGLVGGVIATVIVVAFFAVGQLVVGSVLRSNPQMAMTVALMTYLLKIGVLFVLIILFAGTTAFNTKSFAAVIVACTIAWTVVEVWVFARTKVLYVDPGSTGLG